MVAGVVRGMVTGMVRDTIDRHEREAGRATERVREGHECRAVYTPALPCVWEAAAYGWPSALWKEGR